MSKKIVAYFFLGFFAFSSFFIFSCTKNSNVNQAPDSFIKKSNGAEITEHAPDSFSVLFNTSEGGFIVRVHRDWSPNGADRFYNLVKNNFYNNSRVFSR